MNLHCKHDKYSTGYISNNIMQIQLANYILITL